MTARRAWWLLGWALVLLPFAACTGEEFSAGGGGDAGDAGTGVCAPDQKSCGGACVAKNLPGYGCASEDCQPCDVPNATAECAPGGTCAVGICVGSFADCDLMADNGCEVNLNTSDQCGVCGTSCPVGRVCNNGNCADDCGSLTECQGGCVDVQTDEAHCGNCETRCPPAPAGAVALGCTNGSCLCPDGRSSCDLPGSNGFIACIDLAGEPRACGNCAHGCEAGEDCVGSQCRPAPDCAFGLTECEGNCVSLASNPDHCGSCGTECPVGTVCKQSQCVAEVNCMEPFQTCSSSAVDAGPCFHPQFDAANCKGCGTLCAPGQACIGGDCLDLVLTNEPWICLAKGMQACKPNPNWPVEPGASWFCHPSCPWGSA